MVLDDLASRYMITYVVELEKHEQGTGHEFWRGLATIFGFLDEYALMSFGYSQNHAMNNGLIGGRPLKT